MTDIAKSQWAEVASRLSRALEGQGVDIEVAGLGIGDQHEVEWAPLRGLAYDPKSDLFEVDVDGMDHLIRSPKSLELQQDGAGLKSLAIGVAGGVRHILRFRAPLQLGSRG
ncbi:MAG TPA: DUF5335 family protein [Caulobacteraceae bacterium]|nr:DUF5335 family protein [Caulobacteraceae bacterium]